MDKVWVYVEESDNGNDVDIFVTEQEARERFREKVLAYAGEVVDGLSRYNFIDGFAYVKEMSYAGALALRKCLC